MTISLALIFIAGALAIFDLVRPTSRLTAVGLLLVCIALVAGRTIKKLT